MIYQFEDFELDTGQFELRRGAVACPVEPRVFDLLCYLAANPNRVVTRDEILGAVWQGRVVSEATVSSCVKSARRALNDSGSSQERIKTVRGRGFQFVAEVREVESSATPARAAPLGQQTDTNSAGSVSPTLPVLAVLPFRNLSSEFDEYFAEGLTVDIITNLSKFREFQVIARTSTFKFRGRDFNFQDVRSELGAGYVIEGNVRRAAGRIRISAELVDAVSGLQLWADSYDRDMRDIFAVQDDVTRRIVAALGVQVQDAALQRALIKSPAELGAYDCVLRARRYTWTLDAASHAEARELLESAVARDANYAEAHALLANVYLAEHRFDTNPRPQPVDRAQAVAERAVRLEPQNAYARSWLAIVHFFKRENDKFETEASRALELNPNDPEILADIGHYFSFMGQFERGIALAKRARQLNPLHPGWYYFASARYYYNQCDYVSTLADIERVGMPTFYWSHLLRCAAFGQLGDARARNSLEQLFQLRPGFDARGELEKWNTAADDPDHLLEGLRKAGLES